MNLTEEIQDLVDRKTEGDYWDFKAEWHQNKADLLHDIICMANNQVGKDAYIIIGICDNKSSSGFKIKGISSNDKYRKDQRNLIDFLRDKNFAGGNRPTVYLKPINITDVNGIAQEIDVIIVHNSDKTPYFLMKDFKDRDRTVRAGYIYTRIGDTNTAIDSIADLDKIEYLWRKRFGIDKTVNERLLNLLDESANWIGDLSCGNRKYHKLYPEFQVHINEIENQMPCTDNIIIKNIAHHFLNKQYNTERIVITYHSTVLYNDYVFYLDNARLLIPSPQSCTVCGTDSTAEGTNITYIYFSADTVQGKLFKCFTQGENSWYCPKWTLKQGVGFLFFEDDSEKKHFDAFVQEKLNIIDCEYVSALKEKNYIRNSKTEEYFADGYSKGSEIKAWHLYEQFKGIAGTALVDKLPDLPK